MLRRLPVFLVTLALLAALSPALVAQEAARSADPAEHPGSDAAARWLELAEDLTAELLQDAPRLEPAVRPVLPARLGVVWHKHDRARAEAWLHSAVEAVERTPQNESDEELGWRLATAEVVLQVVEPVHRGLAERVLAVLAEAVEKLEGNPREQLRSNVVYRLGSPATQRAMQDPAGAAATAEKLIALDGGNQLQLIIPMVYGKDPEAGTALFQQALARAREHGHREMLFGLVYMLYPPRPNPVFPELPEEWSKSVLALVTELTLQPYHDAAEQRTVCEAARHAARLYQRLEPRQMAEVTSVIESCRHAGRPIHESGEMELGAPQPSTADDFLRAAARAPDLQTRVRHKTTAAVQARQAENDPERALAILEDFTEEERKQSHSWDADWEMTAGFVLRQHIERGDLRALQRVLDRAPDNLRASIRLVAAINFLSRREESMALTMLQEARRALERYPTERTHVHTGLVNAYARLLPSQAGEMLRAAVAALNDLPSPQPREFLTVRRYLSGPSHLNPVSLIPALLDQDAGMLRAAVAGLEAANLRAAFRLGLLEAALRRYDAEMKEDSATASR